MPKYKIPQIVTLTHYEDKMRTFLKIRKPQMLIFAMHQKQKIPVKY